MISGFTDALGAAIFMAINLMASNPNYEITPEEIETKEVFCLAQNIWFESRSSTFEDQKMVGFTTLNRVKDRRYPTSICEVVWDDQQFSWTHDGKPDSIVLDTPDRVRKWANIVELSVLLVSENIADVSRGATHYHAHYVNPYWVSDMVKLASVGTHKYYKTQNADKYIEENEPKISDDNSESNFYDELSPYSKDILDRLSKYIESNKLENRLMADIEGKFSMYIDAIDGLIAPPIYCEKD